MLLNPPDFYAITFPLQDRATLGKLDGFLDGLGLDDDGSQSGLQRGKRQMEAAIGIEAPQLPIVTLQFGLQACHCQLCPCNQDCKMPAGQNPPPA